MTHKLTIIISYIGDMVRIIRIDGTKRNTDRVIIEDGQINYYDTNVYEFDACLLSNNMHSFLEDYESHIYNSVKDNQFENINESLSVKIKHRDSGLIYPDDVNILPIDATIDKVMDLNENNLWVLIDYSTGVILYVRNNLCCKRSLRLIAKRYPKLPLIDFIEKNDIKKVISDHGLRWDDVFYDPSERFAYNTVYVSGNHKYCDLLKMYQKNTVKGLVGHEKIAYDCMMKKRQDGEIYKQRALVNEKKMQNDKKTKKYNEAVERIKMAKTIFKDKYKDMLSSYEKQIDEESQSSHCCINSDSNN